MKRTYLIVFEKSSNAWGAFAPDIAGTAGLGDTIDEARQSLRDGIGYLFEDSVERGIALPEATSTAVDFSELNPSPGESVYVVEWLTVDVPEPAKLTKQAA
jgi:predicted RNase H-like HicB family nuclease